jgi:hypothetical protein
LRGWSPKTSHPSTRKNWTVFNSLHMDAWVGRVNLQAPFSIENRTQFVDLWTCISHVHLHIDVEDDIVWKFTESGQYSTAGIQNAISWPCAFFHE